MNSFEIVVIIVCTFVMIFCVVMFARGEEIHGYVEFGYIKELDAVETDIQIEYAPFNYLHIYGGVSYIADPVSLLVYRPYREIYTTGVKIDIPEHIYLRLEHNCTHPVYSTQQLFHDKFESGSRTEFAVGVTW